MHISCMEESDVRAAEARSLGGGVDARLTGGEGGGVGKVASSAAIRSEGSSARRLDNPPRAGGDSASTSRPASGEPVPEDGVRGVDGDSRAGVVGFAYSGSDESDVSDTRLGK